MILRPSSLRLTPPSRCPEAQPELLTHTPAEPMEPVVTPDGRQVVFADGTDVMPDLTRDLYKVDIDGTNLTLLSHRPELSWQGAVSPDSSRVAYVVEKDGHSDIHVMNLDGTNDASLTDTHAGYWQPQWSPDGRQILVTSRDTPNGNLELFLLAADGSSRTRLTDSGLANNLSARFTPDGSRVLFVSDRREGKPMLYSVKTDGTDLKAHAPGLFFVDGPTISPDGHVAFSALDREENIDIYSVSLDDGATPSKLENSGMALSPRFSPDGSHLAYLAYDGTDNMQVFESNADGSDAQAVTHTAAFHISPTYTPDGRSLLFVSDESGKPELYRLARS